MLGGTQIVLLALLLCSGKRFPAWHIRHVLLSIMYIDIYIQFCILIRLNLMTMTGWLFSVHCTVSSNSDNHADVIDVPTREGGIIQDVSFEVELELYPFPDGRSHRARSPVSPLRSGI